MQHNVQIVNVFSMWLKNNNIVSSLWNLKKNIELIMEHRRFANIFSKRFTKRYIYICEQMVETKTVHKPITANKRDVFFFFFFYLNLISFDNRIYTHIYKWCNSTVTRVVDYMPTYGTFGYCFIYSQLISIKYDYLLINSQYDKVTPKVYLFRISAPSLN